MKTRTTQPRFAFITGAGSGIGRGTALRLHKAGLHVLAGVRTDEDADALKSAAEAETSRNGAPVLGAADKLRTIRIDVTDADSVAAAADEVRQTVGAGGLFGLVNNAGIAVCGPIEFVSIDQWRQQFEVNLFGQVAVTQAMLPLLRRRTERAGLNSARIINIGSITSEIAAPVFGAYSASKFALAAFNDALRLEVRGHGIGVSLVIPGAIDTDIWRKEKAGIDRINHRTRAREIYARLIDRVTGYVFKTAEKSLPAERVAAAIEHCLTCRRPPIKRLVGWEAQVGSRAKRWMHAGAFDAAMARTMGVPGWRGDSGGGKEEIEGVRVGVKS